MVVVVVVQLWRLMMVMSLVVVEVWVMMVVVVMNQFID